MNITITINTSNSAFLDDGIYEIERILTKAAAFVEAYHPTVNDDDDDESWDTIERLGHGAWIDDEEGFQSETRILLDHNGNNVGSVSIQPEDKEPLLKAAQIVRKLCEHNNTNNESLNLMGIDWFTMHELNNQLKAITSGKYVMKGMII